MIFRNLLEKEQISAAGAAWTANQWLDFSKYMPTLPLSELYITLYGDNVTDEATTAELVSELAAQVYIKSGRYGVLHDLTGGDLVALLALAFGIPDPYVTGTSDDNAERSLTLMVPFGRHRFDREVGLPALPSGDLIAKVQMGTSSNVDGADYEVNAVCDIATSPRYILTTQTISETVPTGAKRIDLPSGLYKGILIYSTTVRDITKTRLLIDDKDIDTEFRDIFDKALQHYIGKESFFAPKHAVYQKEPTAAADGGPASVPVDAEQGELNAVDLRKYSYIDFSDQPDFWLNAEGKKVTIELTSSTSEVKRIVPVIMLRV